MGTTCSPAGWRTLEFDIGSGSRQVCAGSNFSHFNQILKLKIVVYFKMF